MEKSIWEKMVEESYTLNEENRRYINIGYFLLKENGKRYVVGLYRIFPLTENGEVAESFENVYVVYDVEENLVYDEFKNPDKEIFSVLPQIDSAQFENYFEDDETIEKAKKAVKEAIVNYVDNGILEDSYFDGLLKIYGIVDKSSKEFYEYFIKAIKAL